jgi:hypothetical protein
LSEARKYALNLTVANQYIAQMPVEVKDAVFGNVGSIISFRMSADDARTMQRYYEPQFTEYDLVHMHNRHFVISMTISGEKVPGFSAISLNLPPQGEDYTAHIVERSRASYSVSREFVDKYVHERYLEAPKPQAQQPAAKPKQVTAPAPKPAEAKKEKPAEPKLDMPAPAAPAPKPGPIAADPDRPKRKRVRKRKKKTSESGELSGSGTISLK